MKELRPDDLDINMNVIAMRGPKLVDYNVTAYNAIAIQKDLPLMEFQEHMAFRDRPFKITSIDLPYISLEEISFVKTPNKLKALVDTRLYKFGKVDDEMMKAFKSLEEGGF